ncbi:MAG: hypothetical protein OXN25_03810 [Candidatus Poribacteria bacterium]|nr:hypothetical protein [Candidatus Poribacteria bacterium]
MRDTLIRWILPITLLFVIITLGYGHRKTDAPRPSCHRTSGFCHPETQPSCQPSICLETDGK